MNVQRSQNVPFWKETGPKSSFAMVRMVEHKVHLASKRKGEKPIKLRVVSREPIRGTIQFRYKKTLHFH